MKGRHLLTALVLCVLAGTASAQPTSIAWRPPLGCTNGQVMAYNLALKRWQCATGAGVSDGDKGDITVGSSGTVWTIDSGALNYSELGGAFSTLNALPKGDGTGLVSSHISDDGSTTTIDSGGQVTFGAGGIVYGSITSATLSTSRVLDVDNDLSKFGSTDGDAFIYLNTIGGQYATNASGSFWINYAGYQAGLTQPRDLYVGNGQGAHAFDVIGSTKAIHGYGAAQIDGTETLGGNLAYSQANDFYFFGSSGGNQAINLDAMGTGEVRINSNQGGVTTAGTGGLGIYGGANSTPRAILLGGNGQVWAGDTTNTSIDDSVTVLTIGNTGTMSTGTTLDQGAFIEDNGAIDLGSPVSETARTSYLVDIYSHPDALCDTDAELTTCDGFTTATNVALRLRASNDSTSPSIVRENWALRVESGSSYFSGAVQVVGAISNPSGLVAIGDDLDVQSTVSNSTGPVLLQDDVTIGASASSAISFTNGPDGRNTYSGTHYEFMDEELDQGNRVNTGKYNDFTSVATSGTGALASPEATADYDNRFGVVAYTAGSTTTGRISETTGLTAIDFSSASDATWEEAVAPGTLSTATNEYVYLSGFFDTISTSTQVDGCYFLYDRGNVATGGVNTTNANKWEVVCASNSARTVKILDGTTQGGVTTVDTSLTASTFQRLKIVVTGTSSAAFYVDGTLRATLTTNIPSGASRLTGAGHMMIKSAGTTTVYMLVDQLRLAFDLSSARTP